MYLGRAFCGLVPPNMSVIRSLHQRRVRRPFPVAPERRPMAGQESARPPRLLLKNYLAVNRVFFSDTQNVLARRTEHFWSKWKWL
ncbi:hypothetical protein KR009_003777 [Drosophila setifemur]|nr:hypothetical protein KR009_003777 [Drosophila setifemur]